uniref:Uncharacterized protein n=1 Tax=Oreochromis niloticus TaxID=8128 RepID=A0A669B6P6_ORENI
VLHKPWDDDSNFTKWMSSYWGHGPDAVHSRERKRSFRRPSKTQVDRRASLPTAVSCTSWIDVCDCSALQRSI